MALNFKEFFEKEEAAIVTESELIRRENEMLAGWETTQLKKYNELKNSPFKGGTKEKIERIMTGIKRGMEHEGVKISMNQHLKEILDSVIKLAAHQRDLVNKLYYDLKDLEARIEVLKSMEDTKRIEGLMTDIRINRENIDRDTRTEKRRVIRPMYKFFRRKKRESGLIERNLEKHNKVTRQDIAKDVHTFVDSGETQRYLSALTRYWDYLDDSAKKFMHFVGTQASFATEKVARNLEKATGLAYIDNLTGLKNERAFRSDIKRLVPGKYVKKTDKKGPVSLVMIDIDEFKKFNDTYGHEFGNFILQLVAGIIKRINGEEFSYRYGGEEFAVLLPKKKKKEAAAQIEITRKTIEQELGKVMYDKNTKEKIAPEKAMGYVTISAGVAEYPNKSIKRIKELIDKADSELYKAKDEGKNRVKVA